MLEPRRLQGELRAPLWNPRHTGYVTPNAVHAFAARARDYAHGYRSCREKSLAPDHARFDSELASHRHPAIQATTTRSAGVERSGECARGRPPHQGGSPLRCPAVAARSPNATHVPIENGHLRLLGETRSDPGEARTQGRDRRARKAEADRYLGARNGIPSHMALRSSTAGASSWLVEIPKGRPGPSREVGSLPGKWVAYSPSLSELPDRASSRRSRRLNVKTGTPSYCTLTRSPG